MAPADFGAKYRTPSVTVSCHHPSCGLDDDALQMKVLGTEWEVLLIFLWYYGYF